MVVPKILLVDDHEIIREGLCALLEKQLDMEVVGAVGDGRKAVDAVLDETGRGRHGYRHAGSQRRRRHEADSRKNARA